MSNTTIWDTLGKTDPAHTKQFSRSGGFKGTAIKPIWIIRRLTEQFGPVGVGWGMDEPSFQIAPAGEEILVFCTVRCWHTASSNSFFGVGGDKVSAKRKDSLFNDDEAFKKAFTDAVGNAFKFLGVGADVHMGLFDDSKYVEDVAEDFRQPVEPTPREKMDGPYPTKTALKKAADTLILDLRRVAELSELEAILADAKTKALRLQLQQYWPGYLNGDGFTEDFEPIFPMVTRLRAEMTPEGDDEDEEPGSTPNLTPEESAMMDQIFACASSGELKGWWAEFGKRAEAAPNADRIKGAYRARLDFIRDRQQNVLEAG